MSATKHTPGPWWLKDDTLTEDGRVNDLLGRTVCRKCGTAGLEQPSGIQVLAKGYGVAHLLTLKPIKDHDQMVADGNLIIASPDMLAACIKALAFYDAALDAGVRIPSDIDPADVIRAAIAKAEGRTS